MIFQIENTFKEIIRKILTHQWVVYQDHLSYMDWLHSVVKLLQHYKQHYWLQYAD